MLMLYFAIFVVTYNLEVNYVVNVGLVLQKLANVMFSYNSGPSGILYDCFAFVKTRQVPIEGEIINVYDLFEI